MCVHSILSCAIRPLGHHASRCVIGGPRVETYTPLSLCNDRVGGRAYRCCKYIATPFSCPLLQKTRNQQQKLVGRPDKAGGQPLFLVFTTKIGRPVVSKANIWSASSLQIPKVEFHLSGAWCKFLRSIANRGKSGHREGFLNKTTRASMHPLSSEAELRQPTSYGLIANLVNLLIS